MRRLALLLVLVLAGASCGSTQGVRTSGGSMPSIKVVAAENFWGDIASQIGGSHVSVRSIIADPNTDPHEFESDARDAAAVADASLVVKNGLGYDDFVSQLLAVTRKHGRIVVTAADAAGVHGNGANPHLWYSTRYADDVAHAIADALARIDAAHAPDFRRNVRTFEASLGAVQHVVTDIATAHANAPVAYTERVPAYMLADAHLAVRAPAGFAQANEDGTEPSASDAQAIDTLITTHGIKVLLYNAQATSAASTRARELAQRAGIPVVPITETMPGNAGSYQKWQLTQDESIAAALNA